MSTNNGISANDDDWRLIFTDDDEWGSDCCVFTDVSQVGD